MDDFQFLLRVGAVFMLGVFLVQAGVAGSGDDVTVEDMDSSESFDFENDVNLTFNGSGEIDDDLQRSGDESEEEDSSGFFSGDFIGAHLVFEDGTFEMDRLVFEVDEYTGGGFYPTGQGEYSVQLEGSDGEVFESKKFEKPDKGDLLHFQFQEGFEAEYLTVKDGSGEVAGRWFIPDHVCLGEDLPYYCERNGYSNRIDEVELSSNQLDWPRECRESRFNESLSTGSYSGITDSGRIILPVRLDGDENVSVKFGVLNGSTSSLESFGGVTNVEKGNLIYSGEWIANEDPVVAVYESEREGVMCYSFEVSRSEVNTKVVVGLNSSDLDKKALEWKALLANGGEPDWLYRKSEEKELNLSSLREEQDSEKSIGSELVQSIFQLLDFF